MSNDPTLADVILDRLVHQVHKVPLKGESMRKRTATDAKERASWSPTLHDPLSTTYLP